MSKHNKNTGKPVDVAVDYLTRLLAAGLQQAMNTGNPGCECDACIVTRDGQVTPQGFKAKSVEELGDLTLVAVPPCIVDYSSLAPPPPRGKKGDAHHPHKDHTKEAVPLLAQAALRLPWVVYKPKGREYNGPRAPVTSGKAFEIYPLGSSPDVVDPVPLPVYIQLPIPDPPADPPPDTQTPWLTAWVPWITRSYATPSPFTISLRAVEKEALVPVQIVIEVDKEGHPSLKCYGLDFTYSMLSKPYLPFDKDVRQPLVERYFPPKIVTYEHSETVERPLDWTLRNGMSLKLTLNGLLRMVDKVLPAACKAAIPPFGLLPTRAPANIGEVCAIVASCDSAMWERLQTVLAAGAPAPSEDPHLASEKGKKPKATRPAVPRHRNQMHMLALDGHPIVTTANLRLKVDTTHIRGDEFLLAAKVAVQHCLRFSHVPRDLSNESCLKVIQSQLQLADALHSDVYSGLVSRLVGAMSALFSCMTFEYMSWNSEGVSATAEALKRHMDQAGDRPNPSGFIARVHKKGDPVAPDVLEGSQPEAWSWMVAYAIALSTLTRDVIPTLVGLPTPVLKDANATIWSHAWFEETYACLRGLDTYLWTASRCTVVMANALGCLQYMEGMVQQTLNAFYETNKCAYQVQPMTILRVMIRILLLYMQIPLAMYCWLSPGFPSLHIDPQLIAPPTGSPTRENIDDAAAVLCVLSSHMKLTDPDVVAITDARVISERLSEKDGNVLKQLSMRDSKDLHNLYILLNKIMTKMRSNITETMVEHNRRVCVWREAAAKQENAHAAMNASILRNKHAEQRAQELLSRVGEIQSKLPAAGSVPDTKELLKDIKALRSKVTGLEVERNKLRVERDKDKAAITTAKSQLTSAEGVFRSWEESVKDVQVELEAINQASSMHGPKKAEIKETTELAKTLNDNAVECEGKITAARKKIQDAKRRLHAVHEQIHATQQKKAELQARIEAAQFRKNEVNLRIALLEKQLAEGELESPKAEDEELHAGLRDDIAAASVALSLIRSETELLANAMTQVSVAHGGVISEFGAADATPNTLTSPAKITAPAPSRTFTGFDSAWTMPPDAGAGTFSFITLGRT